MRVTDRYWESLDRRGIGSCQQEFEIYWGLETLFLALEIQCTREVTSCSIPLFDVCLGNMQQCNRARIWVMEKAQDEVRSAVLAVNRAKY